nr:uncharacterized protein LOC109173529 [Ipomoea batatas]
MVENLAHFTHCGLVEDYGKASEGTGRGYGLGNGRGGGVGGGSADYLGLDGEVAGGGSGSGYGTRSRGGDGRGDRGSGGNYELIEGHGSSDRGVPTPGSYQCKPHNCIGKYYVEFCGIEDDDAAELRVQVPNPLPAGAKPVPQEDEDDDSWLATIDFDAMVSRFIQKPTTSSQVIVDEIPITSQPPPLGDDEDSQE